MARIAALVVSLTAVLALATPAQAAQVRAYPNVSEDDPECSDNVCRILSLVYESAPGEANSVSMTLVGREVRVADAGAPLRAGEGCRAAGGGAVFCPLPADAEFASANVIAGDRGDAVTLTGVLGGVDGGDGDDRLTAGDRRHSLTGGPGRDSLSAGGATTAWEAARGTTSSMAARAVTRSATSSSSRRSTSTSGRRGSPARGRTASPVSRPSSAAAGVTRSPAAMATTTWTARRATIG